MDEVDFYLINPNQRKFVCEYFKESYQVLGINTEKEVSGNEKSVD